MRTKTGAEKSNATKPAGVVTAQSLVPAAERVLIPKPVTDVVEEKTYITTEPEVEIRRPATLAQALTEPEVAVVKPKTSVKKVRVKSRRAA